MEGVHGRSPIQSSLLVKKGGKNQSSLSHVFAGTIIIEHESLLHASMAIYLPARHVEDANASCTKCNTSFSQPCLPHEDKWRRLPGSTTVTMTPDITRTGGKPERPTGVETSPCSPSGFGEPGLLFQRVAGFSFVPIPAVSSSSSSAEAEPSAKQTRTVAVCSPGEGPPSTF